MHNFLKNYSSGRLLKILALVSCIVFYPNYISGNKAGTKDSLLTCLTETQDPAIQVQLLKELSNATRQTPEEVPYLNRLLSIAEHTDSISVYYWAIASLGRYYTNEFRLDSTKYYVALIDSITKIRKETPEELFALHNYLCRYYLITEDYELAMNEAVKGQMLAEKANHTYGMIYSYENLGLIYLVTGRKKEAIPFFEKAIFLLKTIENTTQHQSQIMDPLLRTYIAFGMLDKIELTLADYTLLADYAENHKDRFPRSFLVNSLRCAIESFYTRLYIARGKPDEATKAARNATNYMDEIFDDDIKSNYYLSMGYFYYSTKEYAKALENISKISNSEYEQEAISLKSDILYSMEKKDAALSVNKQLLDIKKQQNVTAYTRQVDQLKSLRELNEQELQLMNIEKQKTNLKNKQIQLTGLAVFSFILFITLILVIRYSIHTRKLRNALEKEKKALNQTNDNLRIAKQQAEKAEKMKSDFITNVSQEIRTPLNEIIHSVGLLPDASEKERIEHIHIINRNSDSLLKLVSEVLDLSHPFNGKSSSTGQKNG